MEDELDRKGDPDTLKWWAEIEDRRFCELNWCCKVILNAAVETLELLREEPFELHRMFVNYCPQCGTNLKKYREAGCGGC